MAAGGGRFGEPSPLETSDATTKRKPKKPSKRNIQNKMPSGDYQHLTEELLGLISSAGAAANSFLIRNDVFIKPSQSLSLEYLLSSLSSFVPVSSIFSSASSSLWFHRFLCTAISDEDSRWLDCFRMSRPTFFHLLSLFSSSLQESLPTVPPDYALAAAIFRLSHGASYNSLARRFGFESSAKACRVFYYVCKLVHERLGHLDELRSDITRILSGFSSISLPNCCGVLGIGQFGIGGELLGANGSLLVQAVVDYEGRFLDISTGWPSAMKPETILHQTKLFSCVEESKELLNGPCYQLSNGVSIPQYIIGDHRFPLFPWLLTPYTVSSSSEEEEEDSFGSARREFNAVHSRALWLIESAFARVRARWQLLAKAWKQDSVEFFPFVIVTGCLLHNFLVKSGESMAENNVVLMRNNDSHDHVAELKGELDLRARRIRDSLAEHMSRVSLRR